MGDGVGDAVGYAEGNVVGDAVGDANLGLGLGLVCVCVCACLSLSPSLSLSLCVCVCARALLLSRSRALFLSLAVIHRGRLQRQAGSTSRRIPPPTHALPMPAVPNASRNLVLSSTSAENLRSIFLRPSCAKSYATAKQNGAHVCD